MEIVVGRMPHWRLFDEQSCNSMTSIFSLGLLWAEKGIEHQSSDDEDSGRDYDILD